MLWTAKNQGNGSGQIRSLDDIVIHKQINRNTFYDLFYQWNMMVTALFQFDLKVLQKQKRREKTSTMSNFNLCILTSLTLS